MIKDSQDPFGHAYLDHLEGKPDVGLALDRDDMMSESDFSLAAYFAPFEQWPPHQQKALQHIRGRVLDIGCGAGRHSLYLQSKGCDVTGIDESPLAVKVCRLRGVQDAREMSLTQISSKLGRLDTVLMLGNNLGLVSNFKRGRWLLRRLYGVTTSNGTIIAETVDPYATTNPAHLAYHERNRQRGRRGGQVRMRVRYGDYRTKWFDLLLLSRDELQELLQGTGWRIERFIDSDGPTYIAVLSKEPA